MPCNYLILCRPLLLLPSIFPNIMLLANESALRIRWPNYWSFSFNISPSNEHPGLISFRTDVVGSPCSPWDSQESSPTPQFKAPILQRSTLFIAQLSHPYMTTGKKKKITLTRWTFPDKIISLIYNMLSRWVTTFLPRSKCLLIS